MGDHCQVFWSERKARWYNRALKGSDFPEKVLQVMKPYLAGCRSALDIGAGCGALTLPLARELQKVTALEPSHGMLKVLQEEAEDQGLKNIEVIQAPFGKVKLAPHDLVLVAHVPGLWDEPERVIKELERLAVRWTFLVQAVGPQQDKFFFGELYPLVLGRGYPPKPDYLPTYLALHSMGIYASISIVEYDFDQPFESLEEAVDFWKEYLQLETHEYDGLLRRFLSERLSLRPGGLIYPLHKRSAMIYWASRDRTQREP